MITVRGVDKYYGAHRAVCGLNFDIERGACVGLLGLNGAGKSTTLKMLGGLLQPTAGSITIRGISAQQRPQDIRRFVGYLPENPPLYRDMSVRDYLAFAAGLHTMAASDIAQRMGEVAEICGLSRVLQVQIGSLSHGFQQRVGIAQAIFHKPALLILDEPTQGLDPLQIGEVRQLIRDLRGAHTILLSTHILAEITAVCDRILVLHDGRLAAQGTETELVARFGAVGGGVELQVRGAVAELEAALQALRTQLSSENGENSDAPAITFTVRDAGQGIAHAHIHSDQDLRAAISRAVVTAELDLLALSRTRSGLEAIFQNLDAAT